MLQDEANLKIFKSFISGGLAGIISKTAIAPVQRIKYFYVTTQRIFTYRSFLEDFKFLIKNEGIMSLWRGNLMNISRVFPYAAIDFAVFDGLRHYFYKRDDSWLSKLKLFSFGAIGGMAATIATTPIQFVRLRLCMEKQNYSYRGTTNAFKLILKNQGFLGFYSGFYAAMFGVTLYHGFYFFIFTTIKQNLAAKKDKNYNTWYYDFGIGAVSAVGQILSYPFDILRKRMQGQHLRYQKQEISEILNYRQLITYILQKQRGWKGFYKGFSINLFKSPVGMAVVWTLKNHINRLIDTTYDL